MEKLDHYSHEQLTKHKNRRLIDEIKVQIEWSIAELMENYPALTMGEAEAVLTMFYEGRDVLYEEGWNIIDYFVMQISHTKR